LGSRDAAQDGGGGSPAITSNWMLVTTIPAEQAFRPLSEGGCSLVKG
jgi:hypothetical protein